LFKKRKLVGDTNLPNTTTKMVGSPSGGKGRKKDLTNHNRIICQRGETRGRKRIEKGRV